MKIRCLLGALALTGAVPLYAQTPDQMVSARQPAGLVIAMLNAGYDAELTKDDLGDPQINSEMLGYPLRIHFYDCDETTRSECESVQLVIGLDRAEPWTAEAALAFANQYRFAAITLDEEGDPFLRWDIVTGEGIPARVFVKSLRRFEDTVRLAEEIVFADEPAKQDAEVAPSSEA